MTADAKNLVTHDFTGWHLAGLLDRAGAVYETFKKAPTSKRKSVEDQPLPGM